MTPLVPGAHIGEYIVVRPLGAGGFGEVYEAREKSTRNRVALKVLHDTRAWQDHEKFKREALFANRVRERSAFVPNVVAANIDATTGRPWLALEFIDGQTLSEQQRQRQRLGQRWSWSEAREVLYCVMDALRAAHANDLVHCDIKPANIMVKKSPTPERQWIAYVLDFGIARVRSNLATHAATTLACSPEWASPEQINGQSVTAKSDQYAFAQVAYWLLVGERFPKTEEQRTTPEQWATQRLVSLPAAFFQWFARATRSAPEERFESIEVAWNALERAFSSAPQSTTARPHPPYAATECAPVYHAPAVPTAYPSTTVPAVVARPAPPRTPPASRRIAVVASVVVLVAMVSLGAMSKLRGGADAPSPPPRQVIAPPAPRPEYVPVAQQPEVLAAAQRWSAFVQSYARTPVEHVYLPRARLRTMGTLEHDRLVRWWSDWPGHNEQFTVDLSSAVFRERPVSSDSALDAPPCQGFASLVEMRVSVREQKPLLDERALRQMPCTDLRGTYTVRFVRSNGELLVCHENWRDADYRAACPGS